MPQDAFTLRAVTGELEALLVGGKISKINMPEKDELSLIVYTQRSGSVRLEISASAKYNRISIGGRDKPNPANAPNFCMLLRKHLQNATVTAVRQIGFERIVAIDFDCVSDFSFSSLTLYCEIMGKYSNMVLVEKSVILGALKQTTLEENAKRVLFSGAKYTLPPPQGKADPTDGAALAELLGEGRADERAISANVEGIAFSTAAEICAHYGGPVTAEELYDYVNGGVSEPCVVADERGEVVAVIETGDTRQSLDYAVEQGARQLTVLNLSVLAVLAVLLSAVIAYSLHPLGILRQRVQEISDGKLGVQAPVRGNDEVSEITRTFNAMSTNVAFRDREIRQTSEGYARFVPSRVFGLLEKSSVIDVRLEDQTSVEATVLNCSVGAFDHIARSLRSKEMFRLINQVLARLVPVVDRSGGLVDRFDRAGLLAIYTEQPDRALDAAISLCQTLRSGELEEAEGQELDFHVSLSAGPAMIGIVGAERRLEAMTISEHTSFTRFLQPLAAEYGAAVLMTGSAAGLIPDFAQRYHARTIGFVRMKALDRLERLYDVYDGDEETTRRLKEETREQFEKGVSLFCTHQYYQARLLFIEVLKKHRRDKAAKNYLYLCDTYYREENGGEHPVWLETY